jgi:hypothetical protein
VKKKNKFLRGHVRCNGELTACFMVVRYYYSLMVKYMGGMEETSRIDFHLLLADFQAAS